MRIAIVHPSPLVRAAITHPLIKSAEKAGEECLIFQYASVPDMKRSYNLLDEHYYGPEEQVFHGVFLKHSFPNIERTGAPDVSVYLKEHGYRGQMFLLSDNGLQPSDLNYYREGCLVERTFSGPVDKLVADVKGYFYDRLTA